MGSTFLAPYVFICDIAYFNLEAESKIPDQPTAFNQQDPVWFIGSSAF